MNWNLVLPVGATALCAALAVAAVLYKRNSLASWCFVAGMLIFAVESALSAVSSEALAPEDAAYWARLALLAKCTLPAVWLCFSLTYSRGNPQEIFGRSRFLLLATLLLPAGIWLLFRDQLIPATPYDESGEGAWIRLHGAAKTLNGLLLLTAVLILRNLERTFRSAVGTMKWRIKFMILGVATVFGAWIYTHSQALLFSGDLLSLTQVETGALLIGCGLIAVGYLRSGFSEIDIYPSGAVLQTSLTVVLVGTYLFVVGVLAQIVARSGESGNFQLQAFLVLLGIAGLAVALLSNRVRQGIIRFVSRHFKRPEHDYRQIWSRFTQCTSNVLDQSRLSIAVAKLLSETFNVLSVTVWLVDEQQDRLAFGASTSRSEREVSDAMATSSFSGLDLTNLRGWTRPFDLEKAKGDGAEALRQISPCQFRTGGNRICIPLRAGESWLGIAVLADRVGGVSYTVEELDLLECVGDQVAVSLLNVRMAAEILRTEELEAFRNISAFFVHDLKNAASTLGLMLQNLPVHFDNPAFRQDALHGIGETVDRINQLIGRLAAFRDKLEVTLTEFDLNLLVAEELEKLDGAPGLEIVKQLGPVPKLKADREQIRSVITNLLFNASDAAGANGRVIVETGENDRWATLSVADNGCGMSPSFVRDSLFRPFQTTKKKGLGIGMFQSKMIVEAHQGKIQVKSELGIGTTFRILLPSHRQA